MQVHVENGQRLLDGVERDQGDRQQARETCQDTHFCLLDATRTSRLIIAA
jgi:hypothetical protein